MASRVQEKKSRPSACHKQKANIDTMSSSSEYRYKPSAYISSFRLLEDEIRKEVRDISGNSSITPGNKPVQNNKIVVAAVQLHTSSTDGDASGKIEESRLFFDRAVRSVESAATVHGANLVLLQELFLGPYFCQSQDEQLFALAQELDDDDYWERDITSPGAGPKLSRNAFVAKMQLLASRLGVVLPVSLFERSNNAYYNTVVMVDADGSICGRYRKTHIPDGTGYQEKFYFTPGDTGFKVFSTMVGRVGVGICWDQWFPECARSMALLGADVLLYPTAIGSEPQDPTVNSGDHWQRTMQGHAAANMIPVVASNRFGTEILLNEGVDETERQRITFYGRSFITDETGAIVKEAKGGEGGDIIVCEIDAARNREIRSAWGLFRDRRPEMYSILKTKDGKTIM